MSASTALLTIAKPCLRCLTIVLGLITSLSLATKELTADDAKVLPKGRFRLQLVSTFSYAENKFDSGGNSVSLGDAYSVSLTPSFISLLQPQIEGLVKAMNATQPGLSDQLAVADIGIDMSANLFANVLALEYGLTERISVGVILPMVYGEVEVDASSTPNPQFEGFVKAMSDQNPMKNALRQLQAQTALKNIQNVIQQDLGYDAGLNSWSGFGLGDLQIGAKYNYFSTHPVRMSLKGGVRAPTGRRDNPDILFDLGYGDGQWDLGAYHYIDYTPFSRLSLTLETGYTAQLSHRATYRVPMVNGVEITPVRTKLDRDPGDIMELGLEANANLTRLIKLSPKYHFHHKFKDDYSGGNGMDLSLIEADTNESAHEGTLTLAYSNIPRVRSGQSSFPFEIAAFYKHRFAGENVSDARTGGLQLKSFF